MLNIAHILLYALVVAPPALAGDIYKCVAKNGLDLYQNFPCQFDSIGWMPMTPKSANELGAAPAISASPERTKPGKVDAKRVPESHSEQAVPHKGMTAEEVKALWGEPGGDTVHGLAAREIVDGGIEIWTYGTTRTVQFDSNGRVSVVRH